MADTYKGDSPAKKLIRCFFWESAAARLGERFYTGKHVVLASREGGDIRVLLAMGVDPKNIVGVEIDALAAAEAGNRYPSVRIECADVFRVIQRYNRGVIASAMFDFCSPISTRLVDSISKAIAVNMSDGTIVGACFLSGRERGARALAIAQTKAAHEELSKVGYAEEDVFFDNLISRCTSGPDRLPASQQRMILEACADPTKRAAIFEQLREEAARPGAFSFGARWHEFSKSVIEATLARNAAVISTYGAYYVSRTRDSKGIPMLVYQGEVVRGFTGASKDRLRRLAYDRATSIGSPPIDFIPEIGEAELRGYVLALPEVPAAEIAARLNLDARTIAAWRAHETMGTYG